MTFWWNYVWPVPLSGMLAAVAKVHAKPVQHLDLMGLFNTAVGVAALGITIVTLLKVQSVRRAQSDERSLVRQLYGTEQMAAQLRAAATALSAQSDHNARQLAEDLIRLVGNIEGTTRALESRDTKRPGRPKTVPLIPDNYMTADFLGKVADRARDRLDLIFYRNLQFANIFFLERLQKAAKRGVHIRALALWSGAPDEVLRQAIEVMPRPIPAESSILRKQLLDSESLIAKVVGEQWEPAERARFEYRGYDIVPRIHLAHVDDVILYGFLGTLALAQPMRYEERPYIELPRRSEPGVILSRHFDQLWERSISHCIVST